MKVNILGTEYTIYKQTEDENKLLRECDGYCDSSTKEIFVAKFKYTEDSFKNLEAYERKVLRHEMVHAFLYESGLCVNSEWANNEEIVDWIAIQFPKIQKVFEYVIKDER